MRRSGRVTERTNARSYPSASLHLSLTNERRIVLRRAEIVSLSLLLSTRLIHFLLLLCVVALAFLLLLE